MSVKYGDLPFVALVCVCRGVRVFLLKRESAPTLLPPPPHVRINSTINAVNSDERREEGAGKTRNTAVAFSLKYCVELMDDFLNVTKLITLATFAQAEYK